MMQKESGPHWRETEGLSTVTPQGQVSLGHLWQLATGYLGLEGESLVMGSGVKDK